MQGQCRPWRRAGWQRCRRDACRQHTTGSRQRHSRQPMGTEVPPPPRNRRLASVSGSGACRWQQQPAAWPSEGNARFTTASHRCTSLAQPTAPTRNPKPQTLNHSQARPGKRVAWFRV